MLHVRIRNRDKDPIFSIDEIADIEQQLDVLFRDVVPQLAPDPLDRFVFHPPTLPMQ